MAGPPRLSHHELCFGCGQANLFGLQLELEPDGEDGASGRFFVKQDHQGAPGSAHEGVIAAALSEAMSLLADRFQPELHPTRVELALLGPAPVGTFVTVKAWLESRDDAALDVAAAAFGEGEQRLSALARAHARFVGPAAVRVPRPGSAGTGYGS